MSTNPFHPLIPSSNGSPPVNEAQPNSEIQLREFTRVENNNEGGKKKTAANVQPQQHQPQHVHFNGSDRDEQPALDSPRSSLSSSENDDENIHFSKSLNQKKYEFKQHHQQPRAPNRATDSQDNISELPPLTNLSVTCADVWFNGITCFFSVVGLILEVALVFLHCSTGHKWGSGFTALFVGAGGFVVLKRFWGVSHDKLDRLYGRRTKCVRIWVNSFPWLGTIITSCMTTSICNSTRTNPMQIHNFIKLQEWCRMLLRVQSFAQAAPQAVLQLLLLIEGLDAHGQDVIEVWKVSIMALCIITSITNMMIANLPSKSDVILDENSMQPGHKAAYSPYSRLFIGLRMMSSFASRTMTLSLFLSSFRCTTHLHTNSLTISHLIPLSILILPRILFSIVDFIHSKLSKRRRASPSAPSSLSSTLITYIASIFFTFGEPRWIFWYITLESIVFIGVGTGLALWGECLTIFFGISYLIIFILLFGVVPVGLPCFVRWWFVRSSNSSNVPVIGGVQNGE